MTGISSLKSPRRKQATSEFRVGKVKGYLRGSIWYLCYYEDGKRLRPRVGKDRSAAERLAAQVNGQIASQVPSLFAFEDISIGQLQGRWLDHHEHVLRSALGTINRYRSASEHFIRFLDEQKGIRQASQFTAHHAEKFVRHLRSIQIAPNGHPNTARRPLRDKGVLFVLETCRAMFTYAIKRRHLAPYAENPFAALDLERIPIEDAKPIRLLTSDEEARFFSACDRWELPIFMMLALTGMRPGELVHLLIEEDLDLDEGTVHIRNKPELGWQVKTRSERSIPLVPELCEVLRQHIGERKYGPVFRRQLYCGRSYPRTFPFLRVEAERRLNLREEDLGRVLDRKERKRVLANVWWDAGIVRTDRIRLAFIRHTKAIGRPDCTAPKLFRHAFATMLQDANVDPMIRSELMGHSAGEFAGLGMTGVYTHTRVETKRSELFRAIAQSGTARIIRTKE